MCLQVQIHTHALYKTQCPSVEKRDKVSPWFMQWTFAAVSSSTMIQPSWAWSLRVEERGFVLGGLNFGFPCSMADHFSTLSAETGSDGVILGIFALKTSKFSLRDRKTESESCSSHQDCELPTFSIQLTGLRSTLKQQLVGSVQSSWGRIHKSASV